MTQALLELIEPRIDPSLHGAHGNAENLRYFVEFQLLVFLHNYHFPHLRRQAHKRALYYIAYLPAVHVVVDMLKIRSRFESEIFMLLFQRKITAGPLAQLRMAAIESYSVEPRREF